MQLLPNGKQTFSTAAGQPLAFGKVFFYIPNTSTLATTYQDAAGTTPNQNPVPLDGNGQAVIFGAGSFRQVVQDANGVTIWDQVTGDGGASGLSQSGPGLGVNMVNGAAAKVASIAALRALRVPQGSDAQTLIVDGFEKPYNWASTSTATDDGGVYINPTGNSGSGRWVLQFGEGVSPRYYGAKGDGMTDDTTLVQNTVNACATNGWPLKIDRNFLVSKISLSGVNGFHIVAQGVLTGLSTGTYSCVLELLNVQNITVSGKLTVSGSYNTGYTSGVWVHATTGSVSYLDLQNINVVQAQQAWKFGDTAYPDAQVSEINIRGGYTYGCPSVILAIGTQTVVNIAGSNLISGYDGGNTAWQGLTQKTVVAMGATVNITGGELMHTVLSSGSLCEVQPIASTNYGNQYGSISVVNAVCEPACPIATTSNPGSVSSPSGGELKFVGCNAAHTQNGFAFVQTDATFLGRLVFKENNFHCSVTRTQPNINCAANCDVYCDDVSFGKNFQSALAGITGGGILHFSYRMILNVNNLNAQAINNNANTNLIYHSAVNAGDMARFSGCYDYTTGKFTAPAGGLKNVRIEAQWLLNGLAGEWYVQINGVAYGVRTLGHYNQNSYSIDSLNAGDIIQVVALNTGGALTAQSAVTDWLQIFAAA